MSSTTAASSAASSASATPSSATSSVASSASGSTTASETASTSTVTDSIVNQTSQTSSSGISGGAIAGIVIGIIGGFVIIGLLFAWQRNRKIRGEKAALPAPRDVSYVPPDMRQRQTSSMSGLASLGGHHRTTSTYSSSMLAPPRASSTYHHSAPHSRQPSYHSPMMTPNSMPVHDGSPPMGPSGSSQSSNSPSMTPQTPGSASGHITEGDRPPLAPINTHVGGENAVAGPSRSGSQFNTPGGSPSNSPRTSLNGFPSPNRGFARSHSQRPMSMNSLSSRSYLHVGPSGGAPHQRPVVLEMPKRLGARPDGSGDFFSSVGRMPESSSGLGLDEMGRVKRNSRPMDDYPTSPLRSTHPGPPSARRPLATPSSEVGPSGSRPPVPRTTTVRTEPPEDPQVVLGRSEPPV